MTIIDQGFRSERRRGQARSPGGAHLPRAKPADRAEEDGEGEVGRRLDAAIATLTRPSPLTRPGPATRPNSLNGQRPGIARTGAVASGRAAHTRAEQSQGAYYALCSVVGVLSLIGLVMVLSASSVLSLQTYGTPWYYFEHQLIWLVLGSAAFFVGVRVNPSWWRRFAKFGMWASIVMLLAVLVPHVGVAASGASRWIGRGSFQIQPSEFAKLALVFFAADVIERRSERGNWKYQMIPVLAVMGLLVLLVMEQPDMGTTLVLTFIGFSILLTAGMPGRPIIKLLGIVVAGGGLLAVVSPYRLRRLTSFIHPQANAQGSGYQTVQGFAGLSDGGLLGHGLGSSIASWGFLPNAQTDFIFAVIGEETGLVGSMAVAGLFAVLALVGVRIACRCRDPYLALVAAGITAWLSGQALINIGAVVGLLPVTGVPLPFVSFGGSSLVIALFATGVLAAVAKRA